VKQAIKRLAPPADASALTRTIVRGVAIVGAGLLALLGEPTMLLDPFFGFRSGKKLAEKVHAFVRPRHFDAPKSFRARRLSDVHADRRLSPAAFPH
jgi:hypothetical protein